MNSTNNQQPMIIWGLGLASQYSSPTLVTLDATTHSFAAPEARISEYSKLAAVLYGCLYRVAIAQVSVSFLLAGVSILVGNQNSIC